jgi:hypothetical protein
MDIPVGNLVTAVATVISVVIANRLSSSQTGKAKLWDLRLHTYGVVVSELASVEGILDAADNMIAEDVHWYNEYAVGPDNERINGHLRTARQRFSDNYLILSDAFIGLFQAFNSELAAIPDDEPFPCDHELFAAVVRKHKPLLLAQGRSEIAVRGTWEWAVLWCSRLKSLI